MLFHKERVTCSTERSTIIVDTADFGDHTTARARAPMTIRVAGATQRLGAGTPQRPWCRSAAVADHERDVDSASCAKRPQQPTEISRPVSGDTAVVFCELASEARQTTGRPGDFVDASSDVIARENRVRANDPCDKIQAELFSLTGPTGS